MQYLTAILFSLKGRMTHTKMFLALVSIFCTTGIDERQKDFRVGCIKKSASLYIFFLECPTTCMYKYKFGKTSFVKPVYAEHAD